MKRTNNDHFEQMMKEYSHAIRVLSKLAIRETVTSKKLFLHPYE